MPSESAALVLTGIKRVNRLTLADDMFSFTVTDENGVEAAIGKNRADGTITFSEIVINTAGTYEYTVTEIDKGLSGFTYDSTRYNVNVEVIDDGNGKLTATPIYPEGGIVFNNSFYTGGSDEENGSTSPTESIESSTPDDITTDSSTNNSGSSTTITNSLLTATTESPTIIDYTTTAELIVTYESPATVPTSETSITTTSTSPVTDTTVSTTFTVPGFPDAHPVLQIDDGTYEILDENGVPLGYVAIPEDKVIDDLDYEDIVDMFVPYAEAYPNKIISKTDTTDVTVAAKTGDILPLGILVLMPLSFIFFAIALKNGRRWCGNSKIRAI